MLCLTLRVGDGPVHILDGNENIRVHYAGSLTPTIALISFNDDKHIVHRLSVQQPFRITDNISLLLLKIRPQSNVMMLGIKAPKHINIVRDVVLERLRA